MSLLQAGHKFVLSVVRQSGIKSLRTAPVALKESLTQNGFAGSLAQNGVAGSPTQNGFAGLENCFIWDDKHGFGYNKNGEVVIVKPDTEASQMFSSGTSDSLPDMKKVTVQLEDELLDWDSDDENFPACAGSKF